MEQGPCEDVCSRGGFLCAALGLQLLLLAPVPLLGTIGEISRSSPGCSQPTDCPAPCRRGTRISCTPATGNHAEVVWKPWAGVWVSLSLQNSVSSPISSPPLRKRCELWRKVLLVACVGFPNPDFHSLSCLAIRAHFVLHGCSTETKEVAQTEAVAQMGFLFANSALLPPARAFCS